MTADGPGELQRLRYAAFARDATEEDQRALTRYLGDHAAKPQGTDRHVSQHSPLSEQPSSVPDAADAPAGVPPRPRTIDGVEIFGLVGTATGDTIGLSGEVVCLEVRYENGSGAGSCTARETFLRQGLSMTSQLSAAEPAVIFGWGPNGPPGILSCDLHEWLGTCP